MKRILFLLETRLPSSHTLGLRVECEAGNQAGAQQLRGYLLFTEAARAGGASREPILLDLDQLICFPKADPGWGASKP